MSAPNDQLPNTNDQLSDIAKALEGLGIMIAGQGGRLDAIAAQQAEIEKKLDAYAEQVKQNHGDVMTALGVALNQKPEA